MENTTREELKIKALELLNEPVKLAALVATLTDEDVKTIIENIRKENGYA